MNVRSITAYSGLAVLGLIWGMAFVAIKAVVTELVDQIVGKALDLLGGGPRPVQ